MEYKHLKEEDRQAIAEQRILGLEQQHYAATLDIKIATGADDQPMLKEAKTRADTLEAAIASLKK